MLTASLNPQILSKFLIRILSCMFGDAIYRQAIIDLAFDNQYGVEHP